MSYGEPNVKEKLAMKRIKWNENDKEAELESDKVRSIVIPKFKKE